MKIVTRFDKSDVFPGHAVREGEAASLPALYAAWTGELLRGRIPRETEATCGRCAMTAVGRRLRGGGSYFNPSIKCCTYIPEIPNFLLGRVLENDGPSTHVAHAIEAALGFGGARERGGRKDATRFEGESRATPLGLGRPDFFEVLYHSDVRNFGRNPLLRCPYQLESGSCGIWENRPSVCATWYCKYVRGKTGRQFWTALDALLRAVERNLSLTLASDLGIGAKALAALRFREHADDSIPTGGGRPVAGAEKERARENVWGRWRGKERRFYVECARRAGALRWSEVVARCGPEVAVLARTVSESFQELSVREVPERLRAADVRVVRATPRSSLVVAYSEYDPLELPRPLMEALPYFEGNPVHDALRTIEREKRVRIHRDLLIKLVDFGILVPAQSGDRRGRVRSRDGN